MTIGGMDFMVIPLAFYKWREQSPKVSMLIAQSDHPYQLPSTE